MDELKEDMAAMMEVFEDRGLLLRTGIHQSVDMSEFTFVTAILGPPEPTLSRGTGSERRGEDNSTANPSTNRDP